MKFYSLLLASLFTFSQHVFAQTQIPEFKNKVMAVNEDQSLSDLDNADLETELKTNMGGSSFINLKTQGSTSTVQKGNPSTFIVKIESGIDPETVVELFKFNVEKKYRKINTAAYIMGKSKDIDLPKIKIKFSKVEDGVYKITTDGLDAGEYVFIVNRPNIDIMSASGGPRMKGNAFAIK